MARRSSSESKIPADSPAATKLQYSGLNWFGYLRNAVLMDEPVSMSIRKSLISLLRLGLGLPWPTMSKDCSKGTPAFIMVANWRVKVATSLGLMDCAQPMRRFLIFLGVIPWRRSMARTKVSAVARVSPLTIRPLRSRPCHSKTDSAAALLRLACWALLVVVAIVLCICAYSLVTAMTSSMEVRPSFTLCSPEVRKERTPSRSDWAAMSMDEPSRKMMRWISSLMGITW